MFQVRFRAFKAKSNFKGQNLVLQVQSQLNQGKIKNNMAKPLFAKPKP
jgi:hypothetical protein